MDTIVEYVDSIQEATQRTEIEVMLEMSKVYMKFGDMLSQLDDDSDIDMETFSLVQEADRVPTEVTPAGESAPAGDKSKQAGADKKTTKKAGLIGKIIGMIKKVFGFIVNVFKKVIAWIGGLFRKKTKSADQIAADVGIKPNPSAPNSVAKSASKTAPKNPSAKLVTAKPATMSEPKAPSVSSKSVSKTPSQAPSSTKSQTVQISFPVEVVDEKTGTVEQKTYDAEAMFKDLTIKMNDDGTFYFTNLGNIHNENTNPIQSHPWEKKEDQPQSPMWAVAIMQNPGFFTKYCDAIMELINVRLPQMYDVNSESVEDWLFYMERLLTELNESSFGDLVFTYGKSIPYKVLIKHQEILSRVTSQFSDKVLEPWATQSKQIPDVVTSRNIGGKPAVDAIFYTLKRVYDFLAILQYSFTLTGALFNTVYDVDAAYAGTVADITVLDNFVARCVKQGMPSKNIFKNISILTDPALRGPKVRTGQTRAILFPTQNTPGQMNRTEIVYKCAMNGLGVSANAAEKRISDVAFGAGPQTIPELQQYFARVGNAINGRTTTISMERAEIPNLTRHDLQKHCDEVVNSINLILQNAAIDATKLEWNINDLHYGNVGMLPRTNNWALIDYGNIARTRIYDQKK